MLFQQRQILSILHAPRCACRNRAQHPPRLAALGCVGLDGRLSRQRRKPGAKRDEREAAAVFIAELRLELEDLAEHPRLGIVEVPLALERLFDVRPAGQLV